MTRDAPQSPVNLGSLYVPRPNYSGVDLTVPRSRVRREGDVGTWSHCGRGTPHGEHTHDIAMTGEYVPDVECNGTPEVKQSSSLHAEIFGNSWHLETAKHWNREYSD